MKTYVKEYKGHTVPEGATHYKEFSDNEIEFYKGNCFYSWQDKEWHLSLSGGIKNATELPEAQPEWDGKGLPPIDTVCEMTDDNNNWILVEILAVHKGFAHGWCDDIKVAFYSDDVSDFRPLKTKDQETFVEKAYGTYNAVAQEFLDSDFDFDIIFRALFNAGFKAPEGK